MRILHTSDWHLGKFLGGVSLLADQLHALQQLAGLLRSEPHDLLVIAGDVFDHATPTAESVRVLGSWLAELRLVTPTLPILIIAGNHDNGPRLAWTASLLDQQGIYLRGELAGIDTPIEVVGADGVAAQVWALPFLAAGALGEQAPTQVAAMTEALQRIRTAQQAGKAQVLVAHCFVQNAQTSDSERSLIGAASQIDVASFAGFDYVALGHLHRAQAPAPHVHYSGSIARYSFSEATHGKMCLSVEVKPGTPCAVTEKPLRQLRGMQRITANLEALLDDPGYTPLLGDWVELTLEPPVVVGNPLEALRRRWQHILSFHNELPPIVASLVASPTAGDGPRDLEADFQQFNRLVTGEDSPPVDVMAAFRSLHQQLPPEVAP